MLHAYRLLYRDSADAPDSLWEWHQPWIDHLLWHAHTGDRQVVHRYFATWQHLEHANTQIWETCYVPVASFAPWQTWHAWLIEYRELLGHDAGGVRSPPWAAPPAKTAVHSRPWGLQRTVRAFQARRRCWHAQGDRLPHLPRHVLARWPCSSQ